MTPEQREATSGAEVSEPLSERHADWAELFFDLVFVLAVAAIDRSFVEDPSLGRAAVTLALFVPVWWAWVGFAFFATRFPTDSSSMRVALLAASAASLVMAAGLGDAVEGDGVAFALGYGLLRVALASLYWLNRGEAGERGQLAGGYARLFGQGGALWIVSIAVPPPWRYLLWAAGLLIDLTAPFRVRGVMAAVPVDSSHLPERFGLFVMIVIGETLAATGSSVSATDWDPAAVVTAAGCFVAAAAVCWTYFNRIGTIFARPLSARTDSGVYARDLYSFGHFPIVVGIVALAAGTDMLVHGSHVSVGGAALALGAALVYATLAVVQRVLLAGRPSRVPAARAAAAGACLAIAVAAAFGAGRLPVSLGVGAVSLAAVLWIARVGRTRPEPRGDLAFGG